VRVRYGSNVARRYCVKCSEICRAAEWRFAQHRSIAEALGSSTKLADTGAIGANCEDEPEYVGEGGRAIDSSSKHAHGRRFAP
jgi:hypothetical protein